VFANAGVAKYAPFGKITEELYDSIFDINVKGLLFTVQKALPAAAGWRLCHSERLYRRQQRVLCEQCL
jgi:NAD(P)-dependent dehydrogenase (short-subunit alcohol dehydrogenase family)